MKNIIFLSILICCMTTTNATTYFIQGHEYSIMTTLINSSDTIEINMNDTIIRGIVCQPMEVAFNWAEAQGYFKSSPGPNYNNRNDNCTYTPIKSTDSLRDGKLCIDVNDVFMDGPRKVYFIIHSC